MDRPEGLLSLVLFGPARPENRPTGRAWALRQARPGGTRAIRARALSGRAGPGRASPLLISSAQSNFGHKDRAVAAKSQLARTTWPTRGTAVEASYLSKTYLLWALEFSDRRGEKGD